MEEAPLLGHPRGGWTCLENTLRVAVVLHVFCIGEGKVSRDYVERAWAIVEWSLSQHQLIFVESPRLALCTGPAVHAAPMRLLRASQPKPPKPRRPHQDAQWFLDCLGQLLRRQGAVTVREVNQLAALSGRRLATVLKWLELEGMVRLTPQGRELLITPLVSAYPMRLGRG